MSFSYESLWKMLYEKRVSKMDFAKKIGISNATLAKLGRNEPVTLSTIDKICNVYNCQIEQVVQHIRDVSTDNLKHCINKGTVIVRKKNSEDEIDSYYVIIDTNIKNPKDNNNEIYFLVSPIHLYPYDINTNGFLVKINFNDVKIDNNNQSGCIEITKLFVINYNKIERIAGNLPPDFFEKTEITITDYSKLFDQYFI